MRKYVETNFSQKSQTTIRFGLKLAASASETIIFMYIGVSAVSDTHHWDTAFVILTLVFCLIFRALGKTATYVYHLYAWAELKCDLSFNWFNGYLDQLLSRTQCLIRNYD